jgi:CHAT domain-containing protein
MVRWPQVSSCARADNTKHVSDDRAWRTIINSIDRAWITESQLNSINKNYITKLEKLNGILSPKQQEDLRKGAIDALLKEYEKLLVPIIEPFLSDITNGHLKIFPRLQMNAVPIHAIKIGDKRLIETCDVSYNQNLSLFLNIHENKVDDLSTVPLVVYNEEGTGGFLKSTIRAIHGGFAEKPSILINSNWPKILETINNSKSIDLFFACHGFYDATNPALSYLEVSNSEKIFLSKVFSELNLAHYRSVVLGACESGLVKSELASEYVGLASAFLASGIRYFIGSLWEVNEFVTSILLSNYFESLSSNKYTIPRALNEAQRFVMKISRDNIVDWVESKFSSSVLNELKPEIENLDYYPFRHPYYWAGFYVSGDM